MTPAGTSNELDVQNEWEENTHAHMPSLKLMINDTGTIIIIIINGTLARSLEPVVTECKEHTIHTQTQVVASRKPKEIKRKHEGEANFTTLLLLLLFYYYFRT